MVANGVVKVDGNRKSVQHLDGGIVKELRVKEGDRVKAESRTAFSLAHFRADSPAGRRESTQPCVRRRDFVHEHLLKLERAKGFEPSTPTLARSCSTPELRPRSDPAG